jgi:hypothetical protein
VAAPARAEATAAATGSLAPDGAPFGAPSLGVRDKLTALRAEVEAFLDELSAPDPSRS